MVALRQRDGSELWRNDKLKRRGLSAPVVTSTAIAVADYQGYLHWLDKNTGELVARERVAKKQRVSNPPVGVGRHRRRADRRRQAGRVSRAHACERAARRTGGRRRLQPAAPRRRRGRTPAAATRPATTPATPPATAALPPTP